MKSQTPLANFGSRQSVSWEAGARLQAPNPRFWFSCIRLFFICSILSSTVLFAQAQQVATPVFSPSGGDAHSRFQVTVTCSTAGALIYYSLDNSTPTVASASISSGGVIPINYSLTLKAIGVLPGSANSSVASAVYKINGGISGGASHASFLRTDGSVFSWGLQTDGRLGNGLLTVATVSNPTQVSTASGSPLLNAWDASYGFDSSSILDASGFVWTFGKNAVGQLGDNTVTSSGYAKKALKSATSTDYLGNIAALATGYQFNLAADKSPGNVWAWGERASGRIGDNYTSATSSPQKYAVKVKTNASTDLSGAKRVAAGRQFGMALAPIAGDAYGRGQVWAWGSNAAGQLAQGNTTTSGYALPAKRSASLLLNDASEITAGWDHAAAIRVDGTGVSTVWCWGQQADGRLGNSATASAAITYPVQVKKTGLVNLTDVVRVAAGPNHTLALDKFGKVWSWGANSDGQLGIGSTSSSALAQTVKTSVGVDLTDIVEIAAGGDGTTSPVHGYSMALKSDGTLYRWGYVNSAATTFATIAPAANGFVTRPANTAPTITSFSSTAENLTFPGSLTLNATATDAENNLSVLPENLWAESASEALTAQHVVSKPPLQARANPA